MEPTALLQTPAVALLIGLAMIAVFPFVCRFVKMVVTVQHPTHAHALHNGVDTTAVFQFASRDSSSPTHLLIVDQLTTSTPGIITSLVISNNGAMILIPLTAYN